MLFSHSSKSDSDNDTKEDVPTDVPTESNVAESVTLDSELSNEDSGSNTSGNGANSLNSVNSGKSDTSQVICGFYKALTWIFRIIVGATFVFSGIVKAVDPWGTFYKFQEYLAALDFPMLPNLILTCVFALCAIEFLIGVFLLLGCYRKSAPVLALLFMIVMLPLTLWVAIKNPVKDCGCFGDVLIISNWATFIKNVVITGMAVWLFKFNKYAATIITPALQWLCVVASIAFTGAISTYGYFVQPLLDFRPYSIGQKLIDEAESDDEGFEFIYEKNGVRKSFGLEDELPNEEDGWKFIERKELSSQNDNDSNSDKLSKTFRVWDISGEEDVTEYAISENKRQILLLIPNLPDVSPATTWKINSLYDWSSEHGFDMCAVVSGNTEEIDNWKDLSMPQYEIYTADDTAIKEVARGNPAIVYLEDGVVKWKTTLSSVNIEEFKNLKESESPAIFSVDGKSVFRNWGLIYIVVLAVLIMFSILPRIKNAYKTRVRVKPSNDSAKS